MGFKDDMKQVGRDARMDLVEFIAAWFGIAVRFVIFVWIFQHFTEMEHETALEVAALVSFADASRTFQDHAKRVRRDISMKFKKDGSAEVTVREDGPKQTERENEDS